MGWGRAWGCNFVAEVHCGKVPESVLLADPTLSEVEVYHPGRAICYESRGELRILALELFAARQSNRRMRPHKWEFCFL